ncbi:MAG TPA: 2-C-methyl-D-erythritol 2,4-cyclodiphosphate synthase [Solirubrobacterales bacterium]|nr:2-C-methyl-D-erythritol 2,4-cyclodiphosphate synthase [Solirubrobacterales bacterium]
MNIRVGIGFDSHRFGADRPLLLGGVEIPYERGLDGHSDADVLTHAVIDALLGACGRGDIGARFPDDDERWAGADSIAMLETVVAELGAEPVNVDATVICEEPKLRPHNERIGARLSEVIGAPAHVKATTSERMGALGRGEGIAAMAVALISG